MESILSFFTWSLLTTSIRLGTPIILASLAAAICNKAGVLNLAIEGKMLAGAFVAIVATFLIRNHTEVGRNFPVLATYLGVLAAMGFGGLLGLFFAWMHIAYKTHLVVLAIAINLLSISATVYFMRVFFGQAGTWSDPSIVQLPEFSLGFIANVPILGKIVSGYNMIVYASWLSAIGFMGTLL